MLSVFHCIALCAETWWRLSSELLSSSLQVKWTGSSASDLAMVYRQTCKSPSLHHVQFGLGPPSLHFFWHRELSWFVATCGWRAALRSEDKKDWIWTMAMVTSSDNHPVYLTAYLSTYLTLCLLSCPTTKQAGRLHTYLLKNLPTYLLT